MELTSIIKKPIITEKSNRLITQLNGYTFAVAKEANKGQIKKAVQDLLGVKVLQVKVLNTPAKQKRAGRLKKMTKTSGIKKAIVILPKGEKISLFEFEKEK